MQRRSRLWLLFGLLLCLPLAAQANNPQTQNTDNDTLPLVRVDDLPPEAREILRLIRRNGPFPSLRDSVVFGNFEQRLPSKPRGYYHEYTVKTPGVRNRGARRIVCGRVLDCYYTADHYLTFRLIKE